MSGTAAFDVVVIGGGIMGSTSALAVARRGAKVLVLEKSVPGAEASSAAAGILGAQVEALGPGPETELFLESREMYPAFARGLEEASGVHVGYRKTGAMKIAFDDAMADEIKRSVAWQAGKMAVRELDRAGARAIVPVLAHVAGGIFFPDDAQIEPRLLLRALQIAATRAGVVYRAGTQARRIAIANGVARGVILDDGVELAADHVVLAAGSWSSLVEGVPLPAGAIRPVRGQIVELSLRVPLFDAVVFGPGAYLVPRADGRVLVGSTHEHVGYEKAVTAKGVRDLLAAATALVPALEDATVTGAWSSFRPQSSSGKPLLGASDVKRLVLATGHFRNGILLAPITGEIVARAIASAA